MKEKMIIFSDIDGTFINTEYRFPFERSRLEKWFEEFRIVFVSSRTVEEIVNLHQQIGIREDFIAENGSVICTYDGDRAKKLGASLILEAERETLFCLPQALEIAFFSDKVKAIAAEFGLELTWLHELPPAVLAEKSGYSLEEARRSGMRRFSLLFSTHPVPEGFIERLKGEGYYFTSGGLWNSISNIADKGSSVKEYIRLLFDDHHPMTAGIGNAQNDRELLNSVLCRFIIRNPGSGYAPSLMELPGAVLCTSEGVEGFREMIHIIKDMRPAMQKNRPKE